MVPPQRPHATTGPSKVWAGLHFEELEDGQVEDDHGQVVEVEENVEDDLGQAVEVEESEEDDLGQVVEVEGQVVGVEENEEKLHHLHHHLAEDYGNVHPVDQARPGFRV